MINRIPTATCAIVATLAVTFGATPARADVVTRWSDAALDAVRAENTPPPRVSRVLAILHVAIYDAVNGIHRSHEPYLVSDTAPATASVEAAASAAAHAVLVSLLPGDAARFDDLYAAELARIADDTRRQQGIVWGAAVAQRILDSRANDNSDVTLAPPSRTGPGAWVPTPPAFLAYLLPQWGFVAPFAMPMSSFFRPPGPPALDSQRWADDYNEVKALGALVGSTRTAEQTQIALFWADGGGTETPPGHWNSIAKQVGGRRNITIDENARLFALLNIAMADAAICAWDAKYTYDFWRPVTAIRNGDTDGNPATAPDPTWSSFIVTPPFPDYVSGHSTFSGAAAAVLAAFFHTDHVMFDSQSDALPGVTRRFHTFSAAAREAALSRMYGGIHYRSANEDGFAAGQLIGHWTISHVLRGKDEDEQR